MNIQFNTPHQYLFYHQNVKHLLLLWKKEHKRELYIAEEDGPTLSLRYPGETYVDKVLDEIEPIFFQQIISEKGPLAVILGATFSYENKLIAMYYTPPISEGMFCFFQIKDEKPVEIAEAEYEAVVHQFEEEIGQFYFKPN